MTPTMPKALAVAYFAELFGGEHHIPSTGVKESGPYGWHVNYYGDLATYDFNVLTRAVFLAHDRCMRLSIDPSGPRLVKLTVYQRYERDGGMMERHPTLEQAVESWRKSHAESTTPAPDAAEREDG